MNKRIEDLDMLHGERLDFSDFKKFILWVYCCGMVIPRSLCLCLFVVVCCTPLEYSIFSGNAVCLFMF